MTLSELDARLISTREDALANCLALFPNGRAEGNNFYIGSIRGERGNGLEVNLVTAAWADKTEMRAGSGFTSLYAYTKALEPDAAAAELRQKMNGHGNAIKPYVRPPAVLEVPPDNAPRDVAAFTHPRWGLPTALHYYLTRDARLWFVQADYEDNHCPWTWVGGDWRPDPPPKPTPLFGLQRLDLMPDTVCFVVENERTAEALATVMRRQPVLCWWGESVRNADWEPLKGRRIIVWGRASHGGERSRQLVCNVLEALGCEIQFVDPDGLAEGLDAQTLVDQGHTPDEVASFITQHKRLWDEQAGPATRTPPDPPFPAPQTDTAVGTALQPTALWKQAELTLRANGYPNLNEDNITRMLEHAERLGAWIEVWWDEFLCRKQYRRADGVVVEWTDNMDTRLTAWLQKTYSLPSLSYEKVRRCVEEYAERRSRNCVLDWLKSLTWDKEVRLPRLLPVGFGTLDSLYTQSVGRCFIVGMVARAMQPGCKVDAVPVFEGAQGTYKSTALRTLGGEWFTEIHESILTKDFCVSLQGKWLVEISELNSFRREEMRAIKGRISDQSDRFRTPYGRHARDWPRQGVMAGTTNEEEWVTDDTGARRFWPVACTRVDLEWIRANRDQLFAEAVHRFQAGEKWHDVPDALAKIEQGARKGDDPWLDAVSAYAASRQTVRMPDVLEMLGIKLEKRTRAEARRAGECLRACGFKSAVLWDNGVATKGWRRLAPITPVVEKDETGDF